MYFGGRYYETLKEAQVHPIKDVLKMAIENDYAFVVKVLIEAGIKIRMEDLELAKRYNSKLAGRILLNHLKFSSQVGLISRNGVFGIGNLPDEIICDIARFS